MFRFSRDPLDRLFPAYMNEDKMQSRGRGML